jgi:beta-lactamase class A
VKYPSLLLPLLLLLAACGEHKPGAASKADAKAEAAKPAHRLAETFGPIDSTLIDSLRAIERRSGGKLGVAAIHLESGWRASYRGAETFPMASVAKLPMAVEFMRLVDSGAYRLDSAVHFSSGDYHPGKSVLFRSAMRDSGGVTTLHALLEAMITHSDNTAADYILKLDGGPSKVDRLMTSLGFEGIDVSNNERDLILLWAGIDPRNSDSAWTRERVYRKIQEMGDTVWRQAQVKMANDPSDAAPPNEMALLLAMLHRRILLGAKTTDTLLAIMERTATGKERIPAMLPVGTPVAHKTGTIGTTANDVGIVTLPEGKGHLVLAVFVKGSAANVHVRDRAIAESASLIYRHAMMQKKK